MRIYAIKYLRNCFAILIWLISLSLLSQYTFANSGLVGQDKQMTLRVFVEDEQPIKGKYTILVGAKKDIGLLELRDELIRLCNRLPDIEERWIRIYTHSQYYTESRYKLLSEKIPFMNEQQFNKYKDDAEEIIDNYIAEYHPDVRSLILSPLSLSPKKMTMKNRWCSKK